VIGKSESDYPIELAWKWTTPPDEKKMGVFIMICTIMKMAEGLNARDSLLLQIYQPSMN